MKRIFFLVGFYYVLLIAFPANSQQTKKLDSLLPIRGLCISAPVSSGSDSFVTFIDKELAPMKVNVIVLMVDYKYQYKSHPELIDSGALSSVEAKKIVQACKRNNIRLIPQFNLLGHQSWEGRTNALLREYPQFDETPWVNMPEKYKWPNKDSLYCKSYCPLHPDVHKVVFEVVDELCDVFESEAFHAGMDEVFYIADSKCPRCKGKDPAILFADEVKRIHNHLAQSNRQLWIWGDRLLDGAATGIGMWEASKNATYPAIDQIPKDIVICDWHYERADKTAAFFAVKGFSVLTCPWRRPAVAMQQLKDMINYRETATETMRDRYMGLLQTVWSPTDEFLSSYYQAKEKQIKGENRQELSFISLFESIGKL